MSPEDFMRLLRTRPFIPLRIHKTDGTTFDIRHPEQVLVFRSHIYIGLEPDPETGVLEKGERCSLLHIVRIEELQSVTSGQTN
jgi:hypothetical protein